MKKNDPMSDPVPDSFEGLLLGMAVGDALGLPYEGLKPRRIARICKEGELRHRLLFRKGMCSDDTEHAVMTAQALLSSTDDAAVFIRSLAWRLRGWFICLPGGMGLATGKACIRLWLGFPPDKSGVRSAGNGAAMRAPLLGAFFARQPEQLQKFVTASTLLTHRDQRAGEGAWVVAIAAASAMQYRDAADCRQNFFARVLPVLQGEELKSNLHIVHMALKDDTGIEGLLIQLGCEKGVSGYINKTVPVVIYCWLRYFADYRATVDTLIRAGGDTDTTAAIAGGLAGITCGKAGIPQEWLRGVIEWPAGRHWLCHLADALRWKQQGKLPQRPFLFRPALPLRNLFFLLVVLLHGLRRMLPPY